MMPPSVQAPKYVPENSSIFFCGDGMPGRFFWPREPMVSSRTALALYCAGLMRCTKVRREREMCCAQLRLQGRAALILERRGTIRAAREALE